MKYIRNSKGETLVEVIVSLVLFAVLLASVTVMVQTSLNIAERAHERNEETSQSVADIETGQSLTDVDNLTFTFSIHGEIDKEYEIPVVVKQSGGLKVYATK
jgi:uncharacterized protein YpmB